MTDRSRNEISPLCLLALRRAATLAHALPVGARLRVAGRPYLLVHRPPHPSAGERSPVVDEGIRVLSPCSFRAAVGSAYRAAQQGRRVGLDGHDEEPAVDLAVRLPDVSLPGGGVRCRNGRTVVWALPTVLDPCAAGPCLRAWESEGAGIVTPTHHWDDVTAIGIIAFEADLADKRACLAGDRLALDLAAHVAVTELLADVTDLPSDPAGADAPR